MNDKERTCNQMPEPQVQKNFDPMAEAGSIEEEQCPSGLETKTDKMEWTYAANKVRKSYILPEQLRAFLNGL